MKYSNPRMSAVIENWPSGNKRVTAVFEVEVNPKRGERITRRTTGATKKATYARRVRIVDGDDGKMYIAELSMYGFIAILRGDMKFIKETIHPEDPRFSEVFELFEA